MQTFLVAIFYQLIFLTLNDEVGALLTEAEKSQFVIAHNKFRESAAPTAAAMRFLKWNERLGGLAQKAAAKCLFQHSSGEEYEGLGENIFYTTADRYDPTLITAAWYSEKCEYNHETRQCNGVCGHYTQVMTEGVAEIGCGAHLCDRSHYVFCVYSASNGYYNYGPPCSACPKEAPFCVNNLCVSQADMAAPVLRQWDKTIDANSITCNLGCKNCGKRRSDSGACECECKPGSSGDFCQVVDVISSTECKSCIESLVCQNGGVVESKDPAVCSCKCTGGFAGDRCEIPGEVYENSVRIVLEAEEPARFFRFMIMPPVTKSELNSRIWPQLQTGIAEAVNKFCRSDAASFETCCPGKSWATGRTENHVEVSGFKLISSSIFNNFDNSLSLMIYARGVSSLCGTNTASILPQALLLNIIKRNQFEISDSLKACCGKIKLRSVAKPSGSTSSPIGSVPDCDGKVAPSSSATSDQVYQHIYLAYMAPLLVCILARAAF